MIAITAMVAALVADLVEDPARGIDERLLDYCDEITRRVLSFIDEYNYNWSDLEMAQHVGLHVLGVGGSRIVFLLPGGLGVLKVDPKVSVESSGGFNGNKSEIELWSTISGDPWWRSVLVPVLAWGMEGRWLLMPHVEIPRDVDDSGLAVLAGLWKLLRTSVRYKVEDVTPGNWGYHEGRPKVLDYEQWFITEEPL